MAKRRKKPMVGAMATLDHDWRARDDLSTLSRAGEIAKDKARMSAAKAEAKRQMVALQRVAGGAGTKRKTRRERLADVEL